MSQTDKIRSYSAPSRTQMMTGIALFAAVAIILNLSHVQVPAPYLPFLLYDIWEIPIVAALLIFGLCAALFVSVLNMLVLLLANQGASAAGPLYNLTAVVVTLLAIALAHSASTKIGLKNKSLVAFVTGSAIAVRTIVMVIFNFVFLPFSPPLGFNYPEAAVIPILPLIALFNATLTLYTVPFGYAVVKAVSSRFRMRLAYPMHRLKQQQA